MKGSEEIQRMVDENIKKFTKDFLENKINHIGPSDDEVEAYIIVEEMIRNLDEILKGNE